MADTLTTISNFITSPPGRLVAGAVLAGIVWKFFEKVEEKLNDNTKLEIALWLLSVKATGKLDPLPDTFAKVFDQVFGNKPLSWKCFWRSVAVSMVTSVLALMLVVRPTEWGHGPTLRVLAFILFSNIFPDYVSLLETRAVLGAIKRRGVLVSILLLVLDICVTVIIMEQGIVLALNVMITHFRRPLAESWYVLLHPAFALQFVNESHLWFLIYPAFFTSIWLWLYAGSGFLLKFARRFDIGFEWFNRKFDIEHKPLSAIGLVAGCIVAVLWWGVVIVRMVV